MEMLKRVGFIGLGNIGEPMARNLCDRFESVVVCDLDEAPVERLVESGAHAAASCREVGERCDVIGVCVVNDAGTRNVVAGEAGILEGAAPGTVIALHSTIHPDTASELAQLAAEKGVHVVDAQMTGGPAGAEARQLRYMVGGEAEAIERCRPYLEASSVQITHCGGVGKGAVAKLCNNLVQYSAWMAFEEGFRLAAASGIESDVLVDVLSWIMNDNARLFMASRAAREANPDIAMLNERFDAAMGLADKDLGLALEVAARSDLVMPNTELCRERLGHLFASKPRD